jgi:effector-binding domain-containing protein
MFTQILREQSRIRTDVAGHLLDSLQALGWAARGGMRRCPMRQFILVLALAVAVGVPALSPAQTTIQTQPIDPFGQEVTLAEQPIVFTAGTGEWDTALETLTEAFKSVKQYLDKTGLKAAGPAMTIYTAMDDVSFNFQAAIPVATPPKGAPTGDILTGTSPAGKALKFVHRGSFDAMTQTYDTISHHVDEKQISTQELLIEEYITDLLTASPDKLVINIFVPLN